MKVSRDIALKDSLGTTLVVWQQVWEDSDNSTRHECMGAHLAHSSDAAHNGLGGRI